MKRRTFGSFVFRRRRTSSKNLFSRLFQRSTGVLSSTTKQNRRSVDALQRRVEIEVKFPSTFFLRFRRECFDEKTDGSGGDRRGVEQFGRAES